MYEKLPEELAGTYKLGKRKNNHKEEYNAAIIERLVKDSMLPAFQFGLN